jgi:hypothetical protein
MRPRDQPEKTRPDQAEKGNRINNKRGIIKHTRTEGLGPHRNNHSQVSLSVGVQQYQHGCTPAEWDRAVCCWRGDIVSESGYCGLYLIVSASRLFIYRFCVFLCLWSISFLSSDAGVSQCYCPGCTSTA